MTYISQQNNIKTGYIKQPLQYFRCEKNINDLNRTIEIVIELSPFTKDNDFLLSYIVEVWKDK